MLYVSTTIPVTLRVPFAVLDAIEDVRARETRSRSAQILHFILMGLQGHGYVPIELITQGQQDRDRRVQP